MQMKQSYPQTPQAKRSEQSCHTLHLPRMSPEKASLLLSAFDELATAIWDAYIDAIAEDEQALKEAQHKPIPTKTTDAEPEDDLPI